MCGAVKAQVDFSDRHSPKSFLAKTTDAHSVTSFARRRTVVGISLRRTDSSPATAWSVGGRARDKQAFA